MEGTNAGFEALESTVGLLKRFANAPLEIERRESSVVITPTIEGGFPISVYDEGETAMIAAERWHSHYAEPLQAAFCAMWLLTPFYRIVQEFKGGLIAAAWLERYEADGWAPFEPAYFLNPEQPGEWEVGLPNGWTRHVRQQSVLPSPRPYGEIVPGADLDESGMPFGARHGAWTETGDESIGLSLY